MPLFFALLDFIQALVLWDTISLRSGDFPYTIFENVPIGSNVTKGSITEMHADIVL